MPCHSFIWRRSRVVDLLGTRGERRARRWIDTCGRAGLPRLMARSLDRLRSGRTWHPLLSGGSWRTCAANSPVSHLVDPRCLDVDPNQRGEQMSTTRIPKAEITGLYGALVKLGGADDTVIGNRLRRRTDQPGLRGTQPRQTPPPERRDRAQPLAFATQSAVSRNRARSVDRRGRPSRLYRAYGSMGCA